MEKCNSNVGGSRFQVFNNINCLCSCHRLKELSNFFFFELQHAFFFLIMEVLPIAFYLKSKGNDKLKVQKMLYYAQMWNLKNGNPLFEEDIQAWKYGPVVPVVYDNWDNLMKGEIDETTKNFLDILCDCFSGATGTQLVFDTHAPKSPWTFARNHLAPQEASGNVITHESMLEYEENNWLPTLQQAIDKYNNEKLESLKPMLQNFKEKNKHFF